MNNLFEYEKPTLDLFLQWDASLYAKGTGEGSGTGECESWDTDDSQE